MSSPMTLNPSSIAQLLSILSNVAKLPTGSSIPPTTPSLRVNLGGRTLDLNAILALVAAIPPELAVQLIQFIPLFLSLFSGAVADSRPVADPNDDEDIPAPPSFTPTPAQASMRRLRLGLSAEWHSLGEQSKGRVDRDQFTREEVAAHAAGHIRPTLGGKFRMNVEPEPAGLPDSALPQSQLWWHGVWHDRTHGKDTPFSFAYNPDGTPVAGTAGIMGMPINLGTNAYLNLRRNSPEGGPGDGRGWSAMFKTWLYAGDHDIELWVSPTSDPNHPQASNHVILPFQGE